MMKFYHKQATDYMLSGVEFERVTGYLRNCIKMTQGGLRSQSLSKLDPEVMKDDIQTLVRHGRHASLKPIVRSRPVSSAATQPPVVYSQKQSDFEAPSASVRSSSKFPDCDQISRNAMCFLRKNRLPSPLRGASGPANWRPRRPAKAPKQSRQSVSSNVKLTRVQQSPFNLKFQGLFSQRVFPIEPAYRTQVVKKYALRPKLSTKKTREQVIDDTKQEEKEELNAITAKGQLETVIQSCKTFRGRTKSERNLMHSEISTTLKKFKASYEEAVDFSPTYKKQFVTQFRKRNKGFVYGKNFKGRFITGKYVKEIL